MHIYDTVEIKMSQGAKGTNPEGEAEGGGWVGVCPLYNVSLCENAQAQYMCTMNMK